MSLILRIQMRRVPSTELKTSGCAARCSGVGWVYASSALTLSILCVDVSEVK